MIERITSAQNPKIKHLLALQEKSRLRREEGLFVGISAGANVVKAVELAEEHPGAKIVAIVPDSGGKYVSMGIYE